MVKKERERMTKEEGKLRSYPFLSERGFPPSLLLSFFLPLRDGKRKKRREREKERPQFSLPVFSSNFLLPFYLCTGDFMKRYPQLPVHLGIDK